MDTTLDFVTRARHAWQEQPSELDRLRRQSQMPGNERQGPGDHSAVDPEERSALQQFRLLIGIHQDTSFSPPHGFRPNRRPQVVQAVTHRPSPNMGIYTTVCDSEIKSKRNYKSFSKLINVCLGMQIVVAAALTALGAADGSRSAVTVFGAINTIIAGFLTYLKGSGLPHRLKYFQHEWAKIREYIEARERDFTFGLLCKEHVQREIEQIRLMYEAVRNDIETNTPDRYVSVNLKANVAQPSTSIPTVAKPPRTLSTDSLGKRWLNDFDEKHAEANAAAGKAQNTVSGLFGRAQGIKDMLENKVHDLGQMEKDIESDGHNIATEKKHGIAAQVEHAVKEIVHLGQELQSNVKATASNKIDEVEQGAQNAYHDATDAARREMNQQRDATAAAVAQQRQDAENAIHRTADTATATINQQRDAVAAGLAGQRQNVEDTIHQSSDAARAAVNQQREIAAAAIAPHEENLPPKWRREI